MDIFNKKIILASKSPRRSQLLRDAGFQIEIKTKEVEEVYPEDMPADAVAPYLAEVKAMACRDFLTSDEEILLASDCVVILDGKIYGKPTDMEDAKRILMELSGRVHTVMTGVCLLSRNKKRIFSAVSQVHFERLSEEEIHYYLEKFQPFDKAGSYAIQEWIGLCKISKIEGTYSNIMGLPMDCVYRELMAF
ncbi:MAG: septum formation protein Maf [Lewinellaceae bacterium]|nr:septum formation protein Maf [Saprospiraceae bacterium]MCB9340826.1 septum formation protein Maf [Lewinellaceae bacterium]